MNIMNDFSFYGLISLHELFKVLPIVAYFLIYKKFKNLWTAIMFYSAMIAYLLNKIATLFMQGYEGKFSENGKLISEIPASTEYIYTSIASAIFFYLSTIALLIFAIKLHKK